MLADYLQARSLAFAYFKMSLTPPKELRSRWVGMPSKSRRAEQLWVSFSTIWVPVMDVCGSNAFRLRPGRLTGGLALAQHPSVRSFPPHATLALSSRNNRPAKKPALGNFPPSMAVAGRASSTCRPQPLHPASSKRTRASSLCKALAAFPSGWAPRS